MFVARFRAGTKPKPDRLAINESTGTRLVQVKSREVTVTDDSRVPSIDTARIYDRDGGDFYISY